jgi:hypothetical protein
MSERGCGDADAGATPTRRQLLRGVGGAIAAAGILPLPDAVAWARGRAVRPEKRRPGDGLFRDSALTVVNKTADPLNCTSFFQNRTGDSYDPPVADGDHVIDPNGSFRYAPEQFRVGALVMDVDPDVDLYVDVRNLRLGYPRGGVSTGAKLDPAGGDVGAPFSPEQNYAQGERRKKAKIVLKRNHDSSDFIEWELIVGEPRRSSRPSG